MKNLKRILSLALASVMVMGMMVVGASAAFADDDKIVHTEAVTVLNALEVIKGKGDNFDPTGTLTRAEAATLLSILLNKGKAPNYGVPTTPTFSDVRGTDDAWAEGYIEYCYNFGAVSGIGGGKYNPSGTLTATQWARMILNILGIKLDSAASWELRTEVQARDESVDLYNGIDDEIKDPSHDFITRDQAAQMLFNGIKYAPNSTGSSYVVEDKDGGVLYRGNDPITALLMKQADENNKLSVQPDLTGSILKETFNVTPSDSEDAFGRVTTKYMKGTSTLVTIASEALKTYTAETTLSQIANDLGLSSGKTATYKLNGVAQPDLTLVKSDTTNKVGGNGSVVEVYVSNETGKDYAVVQVDTFAGKIKTVTPAKAATATTNAVRASVTVEVLGATQVDSENIVATYNTTGYEKDQIVLITGTYTLKGGDGDDKNDVTGMTIRSITKAPYVSGTVTSHADGYIRVDGEKYFLSGKNDATIGTTNGYKYAAGASSYTYYLDKAGNIIYAVVGAAPEDNSKYIYVIDVAAKSAGANGTDLFETTSGTAAVAQARVLDLETGKVDTRNLAIVKTDDGYFYADKDGKASGDEVKAIAAGVNTPDEENPDRMDIDDSFCKYVELDNGDIVLLSTVDNAEVSVDTGKAELGLEAGYANNTTKLTIYEKGARNAISTKGYTGINNFPAETTFDSESTIAVMTRMTGLLVTEIIVVRDAVAEASTATYAIYAGKGETSSTGTAYAFYVDGELKNYYATDDGTTAVEVLTKDDVANLTFKGGKIDAATKAENAAGVTVAEVTVEVVEADYFVVKTTTTTEGEEGEEPTTTTTTSIYYFADSCVTVDAGDDYKLGEIAKGDDVTVFVKSDKVEFIIIGE